MPGMTTITSAGVSDYQNRTITINVTGVCQQSVLKTGNYQVRVPYSQMSQTLQTIHRQGGTVASVQLMGNPPATRGGADTPSEDAPVSDSDSDAPEEKKSSKRKRR